MEKLLVRLKEIKLKPGSWATDCLKKLGSPPIKNTTTLEQLLKRSEIFFENLHLFDPDLANTEEQVALEAETRVKYEGYIIRQERYVEKMKRMEDVRLPEEMDYQAIHGLTTEVREKLSEVRPVSLGQASRISGVTPAALMALQINLKRMRK